MLGLTCDGLVSHLGEVNDYYMLNTMETGDKHQPYAPSWLGEEFDLI